MFKVPENAITLWIEGDTLYLSLPSGDQKQVVKILLSKCQLPNPLPARQTGFSALLNILHERETASRDLTKIGNRATPVQYDLDKGVAFLKRKAKIKKLLKGSNREKLNRILDELELKP